MAKEHNIIIKGCPNGLGDKDNPKLPDKPCETICDWRIKSAEHLNCSWVMSANVDDSNRGRMTSLRKMGQMLGMTHESVRATIELALRKLSCREDEDFDDLVSEAGVKVLEERSINNISSERIDELAQLMEDPLEPVEVSTESLLDECSTLLHEKCSNTSTDFLSEVRLTDLVKEIQRVQVFMEEAGEELDIKELIDSMCIPPVALDFLYSTFEIKPEEDGDDI